MSVASPLGTHNFPIMFMLLPFCNSLEYE